MGQGPQRPRVGELADAVQGLADVFQGLGRGGPARRSHAFQQQAEQDLRGEPGANRVVAVVGKLIEAAERLPPFELQLYLPPQTPRTK